MYHVHPNFSLLLSRCVQNHALREDSLLSEDDKINFICSETIEDFFEGSVWHASAQQLAIELNCSLELAQQYQAKLLTISNSGQLHNNDIAQLIVIINDIIKYEVVHNKVNEEAKTVSQNSEGPKTKMRMFK